MTRVQSGLDRIAHADPAALSLVRGRRIGLLAHAASVDARLWHATRILSEAGAVIGALFGPEHGLAGASQDMIGVESAGGTIPVHSLYGNHEADLSPRAEWLAGLDAVVVDLQDVGSRYYTYIWTAALMLRAAAAAGIQTIVLDRPNPLGGATVEGAPQRPGYRSFVGLYDVSVRHGLTLGEIATMVCKQEGLDRDALKVVEMRGWKRTMWFDETGLPWVQPSPNMPTLDTATVYPGGCLLEGTGLSEGRGTTRPFEVWGAPYVDGRSTAARVTADGAILRPLTFEPVFHKYARASCGGVQVHVTDRFSFRSYETYLKLIAQTAAAYRDDFMWRTDAYEFVTDRPAIDLLTGGPEFRKAVDAGQALDELLTREGEGAARFAQDREPWLCY